MPPHGFGRQRASWWRNFGQNLAGYTKIRVTAKAGDQIVLTHGETLDRDGNFTVENFQPNGRTPRNLDQKITYICKDGVNEFKPAFSIFGFRYAKVETDIPVENMELTSIAVYSRYGTDGILRLL